MNVIVFTFFCVASWASLYLHDLYVMGDPIILSFFDSLVRASDLQTVEKSGWLNDTIIGFAFEYFQNVTFASRGDVLFIGPEVTQFVKMIDNADELKMSLEPLRLISKRFLFCAVNDNISLVSTGGTHWSLLVIDVSCKRAFHYDPISGSNRAAALRLMKQFVRFMWGELGEFVDEDCPQQKNGYDCGMYVICIAQKLCEKYVTNQDCSLIEKDKQELTQSYITSRRSWLRNLICSLQQN